MKKTSLRKRNLFSGIGERSFRCVEAERVAKKGKEAGKCRLHEKSARRSARGAFLRRARGLFAGAMGIPRCGASILNKEPTASLREARNRSEKTPTGRIAAKEAEGHFTPKGKSDPLVRRGTAFSRSASFSRPATKSLHDEKECQGGTIPRMGERAVREMRR